MSFKAKDKQCFTCHVVKRLEEYQDKERRCKDCINRIYSAMPFSHKVCVKCKEEKPVQEFNQSKPRKDGLYPYCKHCSQKAKLEIRIKNPISEDTRKLYKNNYRSKYPFRQKEYDRRRALAKFKLTLEEYKTMLNSQDNCCAICKKHEESSKVSLAVDHCHTTNKIRGLLCSNCNTALGLFNDSKELLQVAILYLEDNK